MITSFCQNPNVSFVSTIHLDLRDICILVPAGIYTDTPVVVAVHNFLRLTQLKYQEVSKKHHEAKFQLTSGSLGPIRSQVAAGLGLPVPMQGSSRLEYPTCIEVSCGFPFSVNAGATEISDGKDVTPR